MGVRRTAAGGFKLVSQDNRRTLEGMVTFDLANNRLEVGSEALVVDVATGGVLVGTTTPGASLLVVNDDSIQVNTAKTPASASATGSTGQIAWDTSYLYVCTGADTWRRVAHASW